MAADDAGRRPIGRPRIDPDATGPSLQLQVRVTREVAESLDELAKTRGQRRSEIMRAALEAYLEQSRQNGDGSASPSR